MAKEVATLLDGTVIGVSCFMRRLQHMGRWIVDEGDDVLIECWPVAIERQKNIRRVRCGLFRDLCLAPHGVVGG